MMFRTDQPVALRRLDYAPPTHLIPSLSMTIELHPTETRVTNTMQVIQNRPSSTLFLNGEKQTLISVLLDGAPALYQTSEEGIEIETGGKTSFELRITSLCNPQDNTANKGLYMSDGFFCTQCEAEGFRRITYFLDRPDILSRYTVRLEGDQSEHPVLLSNGDIPVDTGTLPGHRHYAVYQDNTPKPCYLFAITAGKISYLEDTFITRSGKNVRLRIYVDEVGKIKRCGWAMDSLIRSMKWDEEKWGREYQFDRFDIVAVSKFNMGAMENTSLNIFNDALILGDDETATDSQLESIEGVVAHEYFHNWTGNRVTCRDWFQLTLKEGLTVFRDQEFSANMNSRGIQRIDDVTQLRARQFPEDSSPLSHPIRPDSVVEINNFYTATVYEKGSEIIRMTRLLAEARQPGGFHKGTDIYFDRHDGQAVTCDEWIKAIADGSGADFTQFMRWYAQAGTPEVTAEFAYDAAAQKASLTLSQHTNPTPDGSPKEPFHIPVAIGLVAPDGQDMIGTQIIHLTAPVQTFAFDNIPVRPVPSILRQFSAPVKLKANQTNDDLRFLMVHDTDDFNRWDSGQTYMLRMLEDMMDRQMNSVPSELIETLGHLVLKSHNQESDPAFMARMLSLPDISIIGQSRDVVDPDEIYRIRKMVIDSVTHKYRDQMLISYKNLSHSDISGTSGRAKGVRALRNVLLRYLDDPALAGLHFDQAKNLTDRIGALSVLIHHDHAETQRVLGAFEDRYLHTPLVMDNWFRVQAGSTRQDTLSTLQALLARPDFDWTTPNRVRAVFGAFGMNAVMFHHRSGQGYAFVKDAIVKLNTINPEIAAQILRPFREYKRYTPDRQAFMKSALMEIAQTPNLSRDVYEIVQKTLGAER